MSHVVVIEAIGKISTIAALFKQRGEQVLIAATKGHLYDLPVDKAALDLDTFEVKEWKVQSPRQFDRVTSMLNMASMVTIMTDPDIEGEVIASHVLDMIPAGVPYQRAYLHQLTDQGLSDALGSATTSLNTKMVNQGLARRIADRAIGFIPSDTAYTMSLGRVVSPLLQSLRSSPAEDNRVEISIKSEELPWRSFTGFDASCNGAHESFEAVAKDLPTPLIASVGRTVKQKTFTPYNYPEALNAISTRLGKSVKEIEISLQSLYMQGRCTYLRTSSRQLKPSEAQKVASIAHHHGLYDFDPVQACDGEGDEESAHGVLIPLDPNHSPWVNSSQSLEQQCLSIITERLVMCGRKYELHTEWGQILPQSPEADRWQNLIGGPNQLRSAFKRQYLIQPPYREKIECHDGEPLYHKICNHHPGVNVKAVRIARDTQVLRRLIELGLAQPSTIGFFASKISSKFLNDEGSLRPKAIQSLTHAASVLPQILDLGNVKRLEECLNSDSPDPHKQAKMAVQQLLSSSVTQSSEAQSLSPYNY